MVCNVVPLFLTGYNGGKKVDFACHYGSGLSIGYFFCGVGSKFVQNVLTSLYF